MGKSFICFPQIEVELFYPNSETKIFCGCVQGNMKLHCLLKLKRTD
uniref:Uncharacterized protein n=1 Tax=Arundo donax TaxID=35708 RepID=A0A0A8ZXR1_ARUDO